MDAWKVTERSVKGKVFDLKKLNDRQDKIWMTISRLIYPKHRCQAGDMYHAKSCSKKGFRVAEKAFGLRIRLRKQLGKFPVTSDHDAL